MVDIDKEMRKLLSEEGFPILLVRTNKKATCHCWNLEDSSANGKCPTCFGTGFMVKIERHITYSVVASVPETLPRLIRRSESSILAIESRNFYFTSNVAPSQKDLIVVCDFNGAMPLHPITFFEISHSEAFRSNRGKVQYYRASTSLDPINSPIKGFNLKRESGSIQYVPLH